MKQNTNHNKRLTSVFHIVSIGLGALMLFCMACSHGGGGGGGGGSQPSGVWTEKKAELESRFGVPIIFDGVEFPSHWNANNPQWTPIATDRRFYALTRIEIDLSKYTANFLKVFMTRLYLVETLRFDNQSYGGTNDHGNKWVYLTLNTIGDNGHLDAVGLHHEFSSILYKLNKGLFPEADWRASNPPEFTYAFEISSSRNIASKKTNVRGNASNYSRGFICEYGELTLEDDINTYSQFFLAKPDQLAKIGGEYERVKKKSALLSQFYKAIGLSL